MRRSIKLLAVALLVSCGGGDGIAPVSPQSPPPPVPGASSMYFNSAEAGCGTDSNVLLCDDFERGSWYSKNCDQANASGGLQQEGGWCGTIFARIAPANAAVCGNKGYRSNCAATSGPHNGIGGANMASHGLSQTELTEASFRLYFQPQADYVGGHEKMFDFERGVGTAQMIVLCDQVFSSQVIKCISHNHQDDGLAGCMASCWMENNVGGDLRLIPTHWYFFEMHAKLNTPGSYDGVFEWWLNDCGTAGTGCTGKPTLRGRYTTVKFRNAGAEADMMISSIWIENWANPATKGTMFYDKVRAQSTGPIGFAR